MTSDLPQSASQPYFDKQFTWNVHSRITSIEDLSNSALDASYGYDSLDRVTSATQGAAAWGYTFNGIGDRLTSTVGAASTTYGYFTGTHRLQSLSGAQSKSYTFDAAGNMTSDGTTTWVYGGNNRPTQAGSTTFLINALGQRVKRTTGASAVRFVYDESGRLWGEYDAAGALIQEFVWLDDLPVAALRDNGSGGTVIYYVHPDHLGTPRTITRSSDNQVVWKWDNTEPFGNSAPDENPSGLGAFEYNLRFPGQYFDSETGTHYNYMRDYDPSLGRYITADPVGVAEHVKRRSPIYSISEDARSDRVINTLESNGKANFWLSGDFERAPLELNPYDYAGSNPLRWVDPTGESILGGAARCFVDTGWEKGCMQIYKNDSRKCRRKIIPALRAICWAAAAAKLGRCLKECKD